MTAIGIRRTAVAVGLLFWISNLVTLLGGMVAGFTPISGDALPQIYQHSTQLVVGTLVAHINDFAVVAYAVLLVPVLARYSHGLALGYAAFNVVQAGLLLVGAAILLSLIPLSQSYLGASSADASADKAVATMVLAQQFWTGRLAALAYLAATPILNFVLLRTRLVPRAISVLGLVGCALLATGPALGVGDPTRGFEPGQLLVIPIILWELTFASWLIVKGFSTDPIEPARANSFANAEAPAIA